MTLLERQHAENHRIKQSYDFDFFIRVYKNSNLIVKFQRGQWYSSTYDGYWCFFKFSHLYIDRFGLYKVFYTNYLDSKGYRGGGEITNGNIDGNAQLCKKGDVLNKFVEENLAK